MPSRPLLALLVLAALVVPASASAHIERASYWPDPAPDCAVKPCAGGQVPKARSLAAVARARRTYVVCRPDSLRRLRRAVRRAVKSGYDVRPTDHRSFSARAGRRLLRVNRRLARRCRFGAIQPAVSKAGNNSTVVVLPGLYTEPRSRAARADDPACARFRLHNDKGESGAVGYEYQARCPNDQNLIAVVGRAVGSGSDPQPPLEDRRGIPNLGRCLRCNLQLLGSGVSADDVVVDAGRVASGDKGPREAVKDVGIRADRVDGFVLRNLKVRHAREHDIYVLESDGYRLDRFKVFWGGEYGVLTFVEDHGVISNCEAAGSGDSGLYPGAGAETGAQRPAGTVFRYSQRVHHCDSHHNLSGYSGTDGNATHIDHDNFYDNALGFTTDVFTAPGHPGYPQDSDLVEYNNFYANNLNPYASDVDDIQPTEPLPVGSGMWIAGGNDNVVRFNRFYDNWRRGAMLFAVPDATVCAPLIGTPVTGCSPEKLSTSYRNRFYGNIMGVAPDGAVQPNGQDFWWDAFVGDTGNCWYDNTAAPGARIVSAPASLPACDGGRNPGQSLGLGDLGNEAELASCFGAVFNGDYNADLCPWFVTPPRPGSGVSRAGAQRGLVAHHATTVGPTVQAADCRAWRALRPASRRALVEQLRLFFGARVSHDYGRGQILPDDRALRLVAGACRPGYAAAFKLYKLYGRAAAFTP